MKLKKFFEYFKMGSDPVYFLTPPVGTDLESIKKLTQFPYELRQNPNTKRIGFLIEIPRENEEKFFQILTKEMEERWPDGGWSLREKTW